MHVGHLFVKLCCAICIYIYIYIYFKQSFTTSIYCHITNHTKEFQTLNNKIPVVNTKGIYCSNLAIDPSHHSSSAAGYGAAKHGSAHSGAHHSGHHGAYNSHAGHQNSHYGQHSKENYEKSDYEVKKVFLIFLRGLINGVRRRSEMKYIIFKTNSDIFLQKSKDHYALFNAANSQYGSNYHADGSYKHGASGSKYGSAHGNGNSYHNDAGHSGGYHPSSYNNAHE